MEALPNEMWVAVLKRCDYRTLCVFRRTCRQARDVVENNAAAFFAVTKRAWIHRKGIGLWNRKPLHSDNAQKRVTCSHQFAIDEKYIGERCYFERLELEPSAFNMRRNSGQDSEKMRTALTKCLIDEFCLFFVPQDDLICYKTVEALISACSFKKLTLGRSLAISGVTIPKMHCDKIRLDATERVGLAESGWLKVVMSFGRLAGIITLIEDFMAKNVIVETGAKLVAYCDVSEDFRLNRSKLPCSQEWINQFDTLIWEHGRKSVWVMRLDTQIMCQFT